MSNFTLYIIIITGLISFVGFRNEKLINELIFWPPAITQKFQYYRFITCGLIHADYMHLIFNMLTLYFFGTIMEYHYQGVLGLQKWYYLALVYRCINRFEYPNLSQTQERLQLPQPGSIRSSLCRPFCFHPAESLGAYLCNRISHSGNYIWRFVPFLFRIYVKKRRRQCKSRCPFLWGLIRNFIYDCRQTGCSGYFSE